ncbi:MAG TPA: PAS domain-containing protein, partial [Pseudomonas sp.]|nr:PAS domain-containing protein [Pseudomonas sp.]
MRNNQPITQRERTFPAQQRLISTTDIKGQITYCNDAFIEISGFSREELMRAPHNLVRHPDVPAAVFQHMWDTLKQGRPWMGIVKNRSKNGDHYWVNA